MEQAVARKNAIEALERVRRNKGSPGIDGMTVDELTPYLHENWPAIRERLLTGTYQPKAVLRTLNTARPSARRRARGRLQ
jgi:RNA-directed DNA polymerase